MISGYCWKIASALKDTVTHCMRCFWLWKWLSVTYIPTLILSCLLRANGSKQRAASYLHLLKHINTFYIIQRLQELRLVNSVLATTWTLFTLLHNVPHVLEPKNYKKNKTTWAVISGLVPAPAQSPGRVPQPQLASVSQQRRPCERMHWGRCDEVSEATWGGDGAAAVGGESILWKCTSRVFATGLGVWTILSHWGNIMIQKKREREKKKILSHWLFMVPHPLHLTHPFYDKWYKQFFWENWWKQLSGRFFSALWWYFFILRCRNHCTFGTMLSWRDPRFRCHHDQLMQHNNFR